MATPEEKHSEILAPEPKWWKQTWRVISAPRFVYTTTFAFGLLLILTYCFVHQANSKPNLLFEFLKELGVAYVIAAILGFSIEKFNQLRHQLHEQSREDDLQKQSEHLLRLMRAEHDITAADFSKRVARDVIEAAYGATIPTAVIRALSRYVLQSQKIRHEYQVKIKLEILSEVREVLQEGFAYSSDEQRAFDNGFVVVTYTSKSIDENITAAPISLPMPVEIIKEGRQIAGIDRLRAFKAFDPDAPDDVWIEASSSAALVGAGVGVTETPDKLTFVYNTPEVNSRAKGAFALSYLSVQDIEDEIILMSLPPCIAATLIVDCPPTLSISVSSIHSEPEQEIPRELDWGANERRWGLATALLPCQGFVLNWRLTGAIHT